MASTKQLIERNDNISLIVSLVRARGEVTRREIADSLSLSWACVSELVALLIEEGMLLESVAEPRGDSSPARGRAPTRLSLNAKKYFIGVDINDSGIAVTRLSINGAVVSAKKWPEEVFENEGALARSVCDKIEQMLDGVADCCGIGVAMEGARGADGGFLYPFVSGWLSVHPEAFLGRRYELPICVRHDPECVLYSVVENADEDCLLIRVDKWIGVAAMINGKISELPLELSNIRYDSRKLSRILRDCAAAGDHREIAEALGRSVGNLALLLGIEKCVMAGEILAWLPQVRQYFEEKLTEVSAALEYRLSAVSDASEGAARMAMLKYSLPRSEKREGNVL